MPQIANKSDMYCRSAVWQGLSSDLSTGGSTVKMGIVQLVKMLLFFFICTIPATVLSSEIKVIPGNFDHFNMVIPQHITAGKDAEVKLLPVDRLNNPTLSFGEPNRKFIISVSDSASVTPSSFETSSISGQEISLTISDNIAETLTLSVFEEDKPVPLISKTLTVVPDKIAFLTIKSPASVVAGETFEVRITKEDLYGNIPVEPVNTKSLNVQFKGNSEPKVHTPLTSEFKNGAAVLELRAEKAGSLIIEIKDITSEILGTSEEINITNAQLHSFKILHPNEVIAGEPFDFTVISVDRFGNAVFNYSLTGNGIVINTLGGSAPFPSSIPAYAFTNGQVRVSLRYDGVGPTKFSVSEINSKQAGRSNEIRFSPQAVERFEVLTPASVIAGQKFKARIIAYNQQSRVIKNYNVIGQDVLLSVTGTGILTPTRIPASQFVDGIAIVELQYDKSESFEIIATLKEETTQETGKKSIKPTKLNLAPIDKKQVIVKSKSVPVPDTIEKKTTQVTDTKPAISKKSDLTYADEKPVTAKLISVSVSDIVDSSPSKQNNNKEKLSKLFHILDFSIDEQGNKAIANIHLDNTHDCSAYRISSENKNGENWVVARIKPAASKMGEYNKKEIASSFVKNIEILEDKDNKETVLVRMKLWEPAAYQSSYVEDNAIRINLLKRP